MIAIRIAEDPTSIAAVQALVRAHMLAHSDVHDAVAIERVTAALPAPYIAPRGCLWVAGDGAEAAGCLALHELAPDVAELKRMYVRPESRGHGVARLLTDHAIASAIARGYSRLRLGTLPSMHAAQRLYYSLGFRRIPPYREVEFGETWFYELALPDAVSPLREERAMSKVVAIMSMSLDGYVADLDDGVSEVFDWYFHSGDVAFNTGGSGPMTFKVSAPSAEHLRHLWSELGAVLTGRRTFEVAHGWDGNHAWGPAFVLTHEIPAGWPRPNSTIHFVTDGIESAVNQAKAAASGKNVAVHGADTIQQLLNAGLLDEIHVDIAAVLLGAGVRLFDRLAGTPVILGSPTVIQGVGVTHLRYPVHKP